MIDLLTIAAILIVIATCLSVGGIVTYTLTLFREGDYISLLILIIGCLFVAAFTIMSICCVQGINTGAMHNYYIIRKAG